MQQLDHVTMENLTPIDFLQSTSDIYGVSYERLDFVLRLVQPFFEGETKNSFHMVPIKECSGGQRRMLSIATALFQKTNLLLLDEPLSGIDSASSINIITLLKSIANENSVTILMTLHQPSTDILLEMDKVMVLGGGCILFDGNFKSVESESQLSNINKTAADFVHDIITSGARAEIIEPCPESDLQVRLGESHIGSQTHEPVPREKNLRLWQVQPLLRRLHLECPSGLQDLMILPICFSVIALWGRLDPKNPLQGMLEQNSTSK